MGIGEADRIIKRGASISFPVTVRCCVVIVVVLK